MFKFSNPELQQIISTQICETILEEAPSRPSSSKKALWMYGNQ